MQAPRKDLCIIVSHYNARPSIELIRLLYQLKDQAANVHPQFSVDLIVVVNMESTIRLELPSELKEIEVQYRENTGFNMGSWEYGWRNNPNYDGYLFLQDECVAFNRFAVFNYCTLLKRYPNSIFGESIFFYRGWAKFLKKWPSNHTSIITFACKNDIPLGLTPSHLQTLVLASTRKTMMKLEGFILSNDKIEAIAAEVLLSRRAVSRGINVEQSNWRPFSNFSHEQWVSVKIKSDSVSWNLSKFFWYVTHGRRDLSKRMKP